MLIINYAFIFALFTQQKFSDALSLSDIFNIALRL